MRVMTSIALCVLCLGLGISAVQAGEGNGHDVRVIIGFHAGADPSVFERHGGHAGSLLASAHAASGTLPSAACGQVQALPEVAYVVEDGVAEALGKPSGSSSPAPSQPPQSMPWGIHRIGADMSWSQSTGQGIRVAVVDTGIDNAHPDFKNAAGVSRVVLGKTFVSGTKSAKDDNDHGTHVTGTIGASNNAIGVVGVAPACTPVAVKVLDRNGSGYYSWIISGIDWAVANNCQVISMSLGGTSDVPALKDACDNAVAAGVVVVAAAGDSGDSVPSYPGAYPSVICVSAVDSLDQLASFSTFGSQVDLAAPGVGVLSTVRGGGYATWAGTSMATPHVSGAAVLCLASGRYPDANLNGRVNDEIRAGLEGTADDVNAASSPGADAYLGFGLVDAEEAVTGVQTLP